MRWPWSKKPELEQRASGSGFTSEVMRLREAYVSGRTGLGELTACVQGAVSLWESGLSMADTDGDGGLLTRSVMGMIARGLALRGEVLALIEDERLVFASDWDTSTRGGRPIAFRCSIPEAGGGVSRTVLAPEALHLKVGVDPSMPWVGVSPLRRSSLSAGLLHTLESALSEAYESMPLGSQIVPMPEVPGTDMEALGRGFRGRRGSVLLRESVSVTASGGPQPQSDWKPSDVTPDLQKSMAVETMDQARDSIGWAFGVLPSLLNPSATGPAVREGQRHLASWMLQPIATMIAEEASEKLGVDVSIDTLRPTQSFDAGGRARAVTAVVKALAEAKEAGIDPAPVLKLVDWD